MTYSGDAVAIEFDGPSHFIKISDDDQGDAPSEASRTSMRTPSTELRDLFLAMRYRNVLFVPWFEWDKRNNKAAEKKAYVAAKLRAAGVSVPAST